MKAGRLFEAALKQAHITLKPGAEMKVSVQGKGENLHLVVRPSEMNEFEASLLNRSRNNSGENLKAYNPKMTVGERIRALRKATGLTLEELASRAQISKGSLCSIEKGDRLAGLAVLKKIAKALGVLISVLVE